MKRVNKNKAQFIPPEVEVTVRAGTEELAAIAFYTAEGGAWDVLVGVQQPSSRNNLASVLRWAADAVEAAAFPLNDTTGFTGYSDIKDALADLPF